MDARSYLVKQALCKSADPYVAALYNAKLQAQRAAASPAAAAAPGMLRRALTISKPGLAALALGLPAAIAGGLMFAASRKKQYFTGEPPSWPEAAREADPLANRPLKYPGLAAVRTE